jgi:hypothetical protein
MGMTVDAAIPVLFWVLALLAVAAYALRCLARHYPGTALVPFRSGRELKTFFSFARGVIGSDKRLLRYPVYLTIVNYLVYLPGWLYIRRVVFGSAGQGGHVPPQELLLTPITSSGLLHEILRAPEWLSYGYFGVVAGSALVVVAALIAALASGWFAKKLRAHLADGDHEGLDFLERVLRVIRQIVLADGVLLVVAFVRGLPAFAFGFSLAFAVVLSIAALLIASLIEGIILFYVSDLIAGRESQYGHLLGRSLSILRPLFRLNILISVGLMLGALIAFPFSLQTEIYSILGAGTAYNPSLPFWLAVRAASYITPVFALVTACAPFFLVGGRTSVRQALHANFVFVGKHLFRYLTVTAAVTGLLCIPGLLGVLLAAVVPRLSAVDFAIRFGLAVLSVVIAVRVFLVFFKFHHDYTRG